MKNFTRTITIPCLVVAAGAVAMTAPVQAAEIGKNLDEIQALAKKEATLRIATSWRSKIRKEIAKGFEKKYGIKFKLTRVRGLASRERILNEAIGGMNDYDLVNVSGELRPLFIRAGIILKQEWPRILKSVDKNLFSPDKYFVAGGFSRYGLIYNTKTIKAGNIPKTWADCLDPQWQRNMAVYTRPRTFTGLYPGWGKEKSIAFHKKLRANKPVWTTDQTGTVTKIAAGEYAFGCGFPQHTYNNVVSRDPTANIKFVAPPDLPFQIGEAFAIMKGAKSKNAAVLMMLYLISPDAIKAYHMYGRSSPFVKGTKAWKVVQDPKINMVWGGWEFAGEREAEAAGNIVEAWGFPKGKNRKKRKKR